MHKGPAAGAACESERAKQTEGEGPGRRWLRDWLLCVGKGGAPLCHSWGLCTSPHPELALPVTHPSTGPPLLQLPHTVLPSLLYLGRVCLLLKPAGFLPGGHWAWSSASLPSEESS